MTDDEDRDGAFESLLDYLKATRGFDFRGYKRATLERRVLKRMQTVSIAAFTDYQDYLEVHPEEFVQLFNTILINVTDFFRDLPAWEFLRNEIVPQIVAGKDSSDFIRVWSAGCAAGQEAYSLAMTFCEAMGRDMYRERVKIYATDADEDALAQARRALYAAREVQSVPVELRDTYFEKAGDRSPACVSPSAYGWPCRPAAPCPSPKGAASRSAKACAWARASTWGWASSKMLAFVWTSAFASTWGCASTSA